MKAKEGIFKIMTPHRPITIYIAAAPDLAAERETLARMIAELPVTLAWRILQTPAANEPLDLEALLDTDLFFLIMGSDIRAPVGLEWQTAQRAGRPVRAFLKRGGHTPAGQVFVKQTDVRWQRFDDAADLNRQVKRVLIEHLLEHAIDVALTPVELEQLQAVLTADPDSDPSLKAEGAGHSAVILSRERYTPNEGVVVDE